MFDEWIHTFVVLFVVIDPLGLAPIFAALTPRDDATYRTRMAVKGTALAALILFGVMLIGGRILGWLGIGLPAFRIAGGVLLFLLAIDMVFARRSGLQGTTALEQEEAERKADVSVFPLAFPLIAGPGAITTILLMTAGDPDGIMIYARLFIVLFAVLLLTLASLLLASRVATLLGETGANVISRLLGLVLAALAAQFILDGLQGSFASL
ncbi:MAG: MarC family protein [Gammaproteobacteria bacterium]|jgi:multiple antibiotic resistance protein|nr:NAAT family transporter [Gammaproteobacteria bacterium]